MPRVPHTAACSRTTRAALRTQGAHPWTTYVFPTRTQRSRRCRSTRSLACEPGGGPRLESQRPQEVLHRRVRPELHHPAALRPLRAPVRWRGALLAAGGAQQDAVREKVQETPRPAIDARLRCGRPRPCLCADAGRVDAERLQWPVSAAVADWIISTDLLEISMRMDGVNEVDDRDKAVATEDCIDLLHHFSKIRNRLLDLVRQTLEKFHENNCVDFSPHDHTCFSRTQRCSG